MKRLVLLCMTAFLVGGLSSPPTQADPFKVTFTQDGARVIATGSGSLDIIGLELYDSGDPGGSITPAFSDITLGSNEVTDTYAVTFLADQGLGFGPGGNSDATSGSGDAVGLFMLTNDQGQFTDPLIGLLTVPAHYVSGSALSDSATWDDSTFASLGLTPGTHRLWWGNSPNQSFTVVVQVPGVPESSSLALFGAGLIGMLLIRCRRASWAMRPRQARRSSISSPS